MSLPLHIRPLAPSETVMVLANWKGQLRDNAHRLAWARKLDAHQLWSLLNYVIDKITLPSAQVFVGTHTETPDSPLCWVAVRDGVILHMYARHSLERDPELAASVQRDLLAALPVPAALGHHFDPFEELRR